MKKVYIIFLGILTMMSVAWLMTCELTVSSDSSLDDSSSDDSSSDDSSSQDNKDNNNGKTGALTYVEKLANGDTSGGETVLGLDKPRQVAVSPDGKSVYVAGYDHTLVVFTRDTSTGSLTYSKVFQKTGTTPAITGAEAVNGLGLGTGSSSKPRWKECICGGHWSYSGV